MEVSFPDHIASQAADASLAPGLNQETQGLLYHRSLGSGTAAAQGLPHQAVVDFNVRPQWRTSMCKNHICLCVRQWTWSGAVQPNGPSSRAASRDLKVGRGEWI